MLGQPAESQNGGSSPNSAMEKSVIQASMAAEEESLLIASNRHRMQPVGDGLIPPVDQAVDSTQKSGHSPANRAMSLRSTTQTLCRCSAAASSGHVGYTGRDCIADSAGPRVAGRRHHCAQPRTELRSALTHSRRGRWRRPRVCFTGIQVGRVGPVCRPVSGGGSDSGPTPKRLSLGRQALCAEAAEFCLTIVNRSSTRMPTAAV